MTCFDVTPVTRSPAPKGCGAFLLVRGQGFEPWLTPSKGGVLAVRRSPNTLASAEGFEPSFSVLETDALPLNYTDAKFFNVSGGCRPFGYPSTCEECSKQQPPEIWSNLHFLQIALRLPGISWKEPFPHRLITRLTANLGFVCHLTETTSLLFFTGLQDQPVAVRRAALPFTPLPRFVGKGNGR